MRHGPKETHTQIALAKRVGVLWKEFAHAGATILTTTSKPIAKSQTRSSSQRAACPARRRHTGVNRPMTSEDNANTRIIVHNTRWVDTPTKAAVGISSR